MKRLCELYFKLARVLLALLLVGMVVLVFGNVVLRYAFNSGFSASEELASWSLTWLTYTAALIALRDHGHLGFDSVVRKFPAWGQRACLALSQILMIGLAGMFLHGSWLQTGINMEHHAPATNLSQGWLYGIGLVFSVIAILVLLNDLYLTLSGKAEKLVMIETEGAEALAEAARHALDDTSSTNGPAPKGLS
jgi:TRAP-type C4-dicarboxylate transport system permease small subunit